MALPVRAQVVYKCDFEDSTEVSQWTINAGPYASQCLCKWMVGEPGNFDPSGHNGLFVSADSVNAVYVSSQAFHVVSYREMTLQPADYYVDFDWRCFGGNLQYIGVAWVPASTKTNSIPTGIGDPAWFTSNNGQKFRGHKAWTSAEMTIHVDSVRTKGKLVFVWISGRDGSKPNNPSGCVDNIVIRNIPASTCSKPTNLKCNEQTAQLTWTSSASLFQVRDYCMNDGSLVEYDSLSANSLSLQLNSEGTHSFYVRSVCDEGNYSEWVSTSQFVWIPGKRCIEYLDIGNAAHTGVCYTGYFDDFIKNNSQGTMRASADTDPSDDLSMHVIHTDINELDPNTINSDGTGGLPTVPDDEIASVRLGARNYGGGSTSQHGLSSAMEYQYTVQQDMSDLLDLKCAVVMESGQHGQDWRTGDQQPFFRLTVQDGNGVSVACTPLDFVCGFGDTQSWHWVNDEDDWCYSDWQKLTISLSQYVGQTLTIRLLSSRCSYDTHTAYGYFTMNCRSGSLEGLACGDTITDHFDAPEGFNYRWYQQDDPNKQTILDSVGNSNYRTLHIANNDSNIYVVECHSKVDTSCYYTLIANPNPRLPKAEVEYIIQSENNQNLVTFTNHSHLEYINRTTGRHIDAGEAVETMYYDFGDGELVFNMNSEITKEYPKEGGQFHVIAVAGMSSDVCQDTTNIYFTLPDLTDSKLNEINVDNCPQKKLINGRLLILCNDHVYNAQGCQLEEIY